MRRPNEDDRTSKVTLRHFGHLSFTILLTFLNMAFCVDSIFAIKYVLLIVFERIDSEVMDTFESKWLRFVGIECAKDDKKQVVIEALRRAKMKFPGRQKIVVSKKWGFTKWTREEYAEMRQSGKLVPAGNIAKYIPDYSKLDA